MTTFSHTLTCSILNSTAGETPTGDRGLLPNPLHGNESRASTFGWPFGASA